MKKSLIALAALTAFAGVASAQSSVTLFGIVDLSLNSVKNGSNSMKTMANDNLNSNRIGFRGVEDLGGGLRAGFHIEGGMTPDNGSAGGQTWARRSTVSLIGGFGEVRLGRDYVATFSNRASYDPFGFNGMGSMGNVESTLSSGMGTQVRANNMVGYFLPAMGGLYGQVQVAAGENTTGNKYIGARLGYAAGPVNVSGSWGKAYKTGTMTSDFKDMNFGASFNMGFMTIQGMYDKVDYGTANQKKVLVGLLVPMGSGTLKASYNKASGSADAFGAKMFSFGYQYDLSKRTALYTTYSSLNNDGNATTGAAFIVNGGPLLSAKGTTSSGYNVGVRHSF
jgi:predicted porin